MLLRESAEEEGIRDKMTSHRGICIGRHARQKVAVERERGGHLGTGEAHEHRRMKSHGRGDWPKVLSPILTFVSSRRHTKRTNKVEH